MMLFFCCQFVIECFLSLYFIRFENLTINGKHISDYVGAWIETLMSIAGESFIYVAPYVGAWIETC